MGTTIPFPPSTSPYLQQSFDGYNSSSASDYSPALLPSQQGYTDARAYPELSLYGMGPDAMQFPQPGFNSGYGVTANGFAAGQHANQYQTVAPADMLLNKEDAHYGPPEQFMPLAQAPEVPNQETAPQVWQADEAAGEFEFDQPSFEEVMAVLDNPYVEQNNMDNLFWGSADHV